MSLSLALSLFPNLRCAVYEINTCDLMRLECSVPLAARQAGRHAVAVLRGRHRRQDPAGDRCERDVHVPQQPSQPDAHQVRPQRVVRGQAERHRGESTAVCVVRVDARRRAPVRHDLQEDRELMLLSFHSLTHSSGVLLGLPTVLHFFLSLGIVNASLLLMLV